MEAIIYTRINKYVAFHDFLHGFCVGRVIGIAIMEINFAQDLESVDQDPLFLVLLGLRKVYDNLDRGWILKTLEGYGAGPKMWVILEEF